MTLLLDAGAHGTRPITGQMLTMVMCGMARAARARRNALLLDFDVIWRRSGCDRFTTTFDSAKSVHELMGEFSTCASLGLFVQMELRRLC